MLEQVGRRLGGAAAARPSGGARRAGWVQLGGRLSGARQTGMRRRADARAHGRMCMFRGEPQRRRLRAMSCRRVALPPLQLSAPSSRGRAGRVTVGTREGLRQALGPCVGHRTLPATLRVDVDADRLASSRLRAPRRASTPKQTSPAAPPSRAASGDRSERRAPELHVAARCAHARSAHARARAPRVAVIPSETELASGRRLPNFEI